MRYEPSDEVVQGPGHLLGLARNGKTVFVKRFFRSKPVSARFVANMSFATVVRLLDFGSIRVAKLREEASDEVH